MKRWLLLFCWGLLCSGDAEEQCDGDEITTVDSDSPLWVARQPQLGSILDKIFVLHHSPLRARRDLLTKHLKDRLIPDGMVEWITEVEADTLASDIPYKHWRYLEDKLSTCNTVKM